MAPLPLLKIGAVLFKEISKPIAAYIKREAVQHPLLRQVAMTLGRNYETGTQRIEKIFSGNKLIQIKPVSDTHALTVGADLVAQGFLLTTAIGLVILEYWRNARIKAQEDLVKSCQKMERQALKKQKLQDMENEIQSAYQRISTLEQKIKILTGEEEEEAETLERSNSSSKKKNSSWLSSWFR